MGDLLPPDGQADQFAVPPESADDAAVAHADINGAASDALGWAEPVQVPHGPADHDAFAPFHGEPQVQQQAPRVSQLTQPSLPSDLQALSAILPVDCDFKPPLTHSSPSLSLFFFAFLSRNRPRTFAQHATSQGRRAESSGFV